jgi:hypothetical protein
MTSVDEIDRDREAQASTVESARVEKSVGSVEGTRTEARDEVAHKRERGKPFDSDRAREAARLSAERRRARQAGDDTSDEAIEQALRRKAARGDVAAARELRERARVKLDVATETTPRVVLEDMSNEELERLQERLLRMAVRMNERAARAQARAEGAAPPERRSPGPDVGTNLPGGEIDAQVKTMNDRWFRLSRRPFPRSGLKNRADVEQKGSRP